MDNMNLAVVFHGAALAAVLTDSAYREQFGMANPNLELLEKLHDTGVRFFACDKSNLSRQLQGQHCAPAAISGYSRGCKSPLSADHGDRACSKALDPVVLQPYFRPR